MLCFYFFSFLHNILWYTKFNYNLNQKNLIHKKVEIKKLIIKGGTFMSSNDMLVQILKIVNDLKEDVKENRREILKSREIKESHWQEFQKQWEKSK